MNATKLGAVALLSLVLAGCAAPVTKEAAAKADFGAKPTKEEALKKINVFLQENLLDPDSMKLRCSEVRKGWARNDMFEKPIFGWTVLCGVNARNRFGGYTGEQQYLFLFKGGYMGHTKIDNIRDLENRTGLLD